MSRRRATEAKEHERFRHDAVLALSAFLVVWGFLLVFENAFFAAPGFGVPTPSWAQWVGNVPLNVLLAIDTAAVFSVVAIVILTWKRRAQVLRHSVRGGAVVTGVIILILFFGGAVVAFSVFHLTFQSLWCSLLGFFGRSC